MRTWVGACALVVAVAAVGCDRGDDQRTDTLTRDVVAGARAGLAPELVAALDSGNLAVRAADYEGALAYYRRATDLDPDAAAGWFGVYMAAGALGRADEAEEALARARAAAPGATLLRPDTVP